ncbi:MAG: Crp/Fnr family transcriptional regulator [Anaerolineales bacterium]|nr:Crp/Fnr family transcriptional regulator [Anaerolineales bacterium]
MQIEKINYLSDIHIFRDLPPTDLAQMDRQLAMISCAPGKIFYMPEDNGEALFLIKRGRVQLYRLSPGGKKLVVAMLGAGAMFGEMALVGQGMHSTFAEALDECLICVMSRADVERLVVEKPAVAFRFLEVMGNRVTALESHLEAIAFKSISARLASLLLKLAAEQDDNNVVQGYTHQDFSDMLGTYRETITQTLNDFKGNGLVEIGRKRIALLNRTQLEILGEG